MNQPLKNQIDIQLIKQIAHGLNELDPSFCVNSFVQKTKMNWEKRELKERIYQISENLNLSLKGDFKEKTHLLKSVAPKISGLGALVFPDFIGRFGLNEDWKTCMQALEYFTPFFSSEFGVRPFMILNQARMLRQMEEWTKHDNHHVRRLASEGARPRLPWATKIASLIKNPAPILPILEKLKDDESLYVRKSVANSLNDISKDHRELALSIGRKWHGSSQRTDWVVKHGLRTLIKKGQPDALSLFGLNKLNRFFILHLKLDRAQISIGETVHFSFVAINSSPKSQLVRLEYFIYFTRKNGTLSKKIFKISEKILAPGEHKISRRHEMKTMTTRKIYPGRHKIEIVANGLPLCSQEFTVESKRNHANP